MIQQGKYVVNGRKKERGIERKTIYVNLRAERNRKRKMETRRMEGVKCDK